MQIQLAPSWELTTESTQSHYRIPVLRHCPTGDDYGPSDMITCLPSYGLEPAARVVIRLSQINPTDEKTAAAKLFCSQWPDGPKR